MTLGGAPIQEDGTWNGHWKQLTVPVNNIIAVSMPPASAAVIRVRLR